MKVMQYDPEDYEYALRILYHRAELQDREVERWMTDPEHLEILEELACISVQGQSIPEEKIICERNSLARELCGSRKKWRRIGWSVVAASVSLFLAISYFYIEARKTIVAPVAMTEAIVPGSAKARLLLADGQAIDLNHKTQCIRKTRESSVWNDSLGGLKYVVREKEGGAGTEEYNTLQVPAGGFYRLELADGTQVWLNSGTELRYPVHFVGKERRVYLRGEGYFRVAKDREKPFQVQVNGGKITVLGTVFNVSAYTDEAEVVTTLAEGSVRCEAEKSGTQQVLRPGQQSVTDVLTGKTVVNEVNPAHYTAWVEGQFIFRFMNLEKIMRQLERWYDFEVVYQDAEIKDYQFQGMIKRDSRIEDVFKVIEITTDIKFTISGKQVVVRKNNRK